MLLIGLKLCVSSLDKTLALRQGCGTVGAQANPSYVVHLALPLSLLLKKISPLLMGLVSPLTASHLAGSTRLTHGSA